MDIKVNITKRSDVQIGDTCRFIWEDCKIALGKYSDMKVIKIHTTKSGMIKITFSGTYTSSEGVSQPTTNSFGLGKADKFVVERK